MLDCVVSMEVYGYGRDSHNRTICTCQFVATTVITSVGLLGVHVEKSVTVHSCPRCGVLHAMNVEEDKVA